MPAKPIVHTYAEAFRCTGSACEDTCCQGWSVPIDQPACQKYQTLPDSPLRTLIQASILPAPNPRDDAKPPAFATLRMNAANQCPLLTEDRLCRIHGELGQDFLAYSCATYPRIVRTIGGIQEKALALSCPEAARLVLLCPELPVIACAPPADPHCEETDPPGQPQSAPQLWFWPVRNAVLALLKNRDYPLWQRLFLLSLLCQRLNSIWNGDLKQSVPNLLRGFAATVAARTLQPAMDTLPADDQAQLDVVLRLAGLLLHRSNITPRFIECVQWFTAGIGNGPGATLQSLTDNYAAAHNLYYAPFFARHPYILENYLTNLVVRLQFPFGRDAMQPGASAAAPPSMIRESVMLTAQFVLMKGLLIGVAGHHRDSFSAAHVIHTVQAASKHFEHHPEFLQMAYNLLVESRMDGAQGLSILARNGRPAAPHSSGNGLHALTTHLTTPRLSS